jgi:hypothetical protein
MNRYPKYVASKRLEEPLEWNNSHLLEGDLADAVGRLKDWVHPLVLGEGRRLFEDGKRTELELVDTTTLPNGVAVLDYQLAG